MNRFIVIEDFNDTTNIVSLNGVGPKIFNSVQDAYEEASKCQNGIVVNLNRYKRLYVVHTDVISSPPTYVVADSYGDAEIIFNNVYPNNSIARIELVSMYLI